MEVITLTNVGYLLLSLGLGLVGWQFLQSYLKVYRAGGLGTIGLYLAGVFLMLALHMGAVALTTVLPGYALVALSASIVSFIILASASAISLNLATYILYPRIPKAIGRIPLILLGILSAWLLLFIYRNPVNITEIPLVFERAMSFLYAATFIPLFFVFQHFYTLSRDKDTKDKSFVLMLLIGVSFASILIKFTPVPAPMDALVIALAGVGFLASVIIPKSQRLLARKSKISTTPTLEQP